MELCDIAIHSGEAGYTHIYMYHISQTPFRTVKDALRGQNYMVLLRVKKQVDPLLANIKSNVGAFFPD